MRRCRASEWSWRREISALDGEQGVKQILAAVQRDGDDALRHFTAQFDGRSEAVSDAWPLRVPQTVLSGALATLDASMREALSAAADRIRAFHAAQRPTEVWWTSGDGDRLGMHWRPLRRVGVYAPGGRAAYPSTVLMDVIPAQVAGVEEIALASPPFGDTGWPHPLVLAAAALLGVDEVYRVGGAQAIAAFAYGTKSVPRVDKIVGPGNRYVALAKRAVVGDVGIDSVAGPSEVFVVADETANPEFIAADLLAQAEHDPDAGAVCILAGADSLADAVEGALIRQLETLPRRAEAERALAEWGSIVLARDVTEALDIVNQAAPEHLELLVANASDWLPRVRTAGAVFVGPWSPEPVGDYYAGSNHVLPTHGSARFQSGLGVHDFLRRMTSVEYSEQTLAKHRSHIVQLARCEGLEAHARAVLARNLEVKSEVGGEKVGRPGEADVYGASGAENGRDTD
ncbi:histidinol dehydrogenase [Alicyclobacillus herbarius]|uniref:histidinol dehydrogenase n=1 Tax=Alicyclobacillus herbarius TaxID=122960 RepID=UPI0006846668|nr:histidinol dehydrogenase [Alicyclobacillus herbarius]